MPITVRMTARVRRRTSCSIALLAALALGSLDASANAAGSAATPLPGGALQAPDEYASGHVPGAVNIPFRELAEERSLALFPRGKQIVFTCEDGHRSMAAARRSTLFPWGSR